MAIFSSGEALTSLGYKVLFQHRLLTPGQDDPPISPFGDPRGLFRPGMVPAKNLSYRIYIQTLEGVTSSTLSFVTSAAGGIGSILLQNIPEVVLARTESRTAVVVFEGKDVIDLETKDLERDGDAIIVPDYVFRPIYAGDRPLVENDEDLVTNCTLAYELPGFKDNALLGMAISEGAPVDVVKAAPQQGRLAVDSASKKIRVRGSPSLVSYVAMRKALFRDVVTIIGTSQGIGVVRIPDGLLITQTSAGQTRDAFVLRFAFVNVAAPGEPERMQWRLSESYGVDTTGSVTKTPQDLLRDIAVTDVTRNSLAELNKHYVYNLADLNGQDTTDENFSKPAKDAVSPLLAKAKMDPASSYYDKNFTAQIIDFELGLGSTGRAVDTLAVGVPTSGKDALVPQFQYSSASYRVNLSGLGRLGYEYTLRKPNLMNVLTGPRDAVLLAKTVEGASGLALSYDCCMHKAHVFQSFASSAGPTLLERWYEDVLWQKPKFKPPVSPESDLATFMIGEYPFVSEGRATLIPLQTLLDTDVSGGTVTLEPDFYVTSIIMGVPRSGTNAVLKLFAANPTGKPLFEASIKNVGSGGEITVGTPPLKFASWTATGGLTLMKVAGLKKDEQILEAMTGDKSSNDPSEFQLANVEEQKFPVAAGGIAATGDCTTGWSLLAFENESRIDLAIRVQYSKPFQMVRDAVLRIPNNVASSGKTKDDIPPASLPFLLSDVDTDTSYLFYVYKEKLLVKIIPMKVFQGPASAGPYRRYDIAGEMDIAKKLHKLGAALVYDGSGKGKLDSLGVDLENNAIRITNDPNPSKETPTPVTQYGAMQDPNGNVYVFMQAEDRLVVRKSHNLCAAWIDVLPRTFSFVPAKDADEAASERATLAPYPLCDHLTKTVVLFFFYESSMLFVRLPAEKLRNLASETLAEEFGKIKPQVLVGPLSSNMSDRGITRNVGVDKKEGDDSEYPKLSPHRVTAVVTAEGYYRVWFQDGDQKLRSLISTDTGITWRDERDALEEVP